MNLTQQPPAALIPRREEQTDLSSIFTLVCQVLWNGHNGHCMVGSLIQTIGPSMCDKSSDGWVRQHVILGSPVDGADMSRQAKRRQLQSPCNHVQAHPFSKFPFFEKPLRPLNHDSKHIQSFANRSNHLSCKETSCSRTMNLFVMQAGRAAV